MNNIESIQTRRAMDKEIKNKTIQVDIFEEVVDFERLREESSRKLSDWEDSDFFGVEFEFDENDGDNNDQVETVIQQDILDTRNVHSSHGSQLVPRVVNNRVEFTTVLQDKNNPDFLNSSKKFEMINIVESFCDVDELPSPQEITVQEIFTRSPKNKSRKRFSVFSNTKGLLKRMISKNILSSDHEEIPSDHCKGTIEDCESFEWTYYLALQGNTDCKFSLGYMYDTGAGYVLKNTEQAIHWYNQAACEGHSIAQNNLGVLYSSGHRGRIPPDQGEAFHWYKKASETGYVNAQFHLGLMYMKGSGVEERDEKAAFYWFKKAAKMGHLNSMTNIGAMYMNGKGTAIDHKKSLKWTRKAYNRGSKVAAHNLASMLDQGICVQVDHEKAQSLLLESRKGNASVPVELSRTAFQNHSILMNL